MRYPRGEALGVPLPATPERIGIGTGEVLREGERVALVGYGSGVGRALGAADLLARDGLDVTVADARFAKPLDAGLLAQLAAEHDLLVTVEEGVLAGGFGTAVWECLSDGGVAPRILRVGLPDRYVTHGAPRLLHEEVGFTAERIAERVEAAVLDPAARWPGPDRAPAHAPRRRTGTVSRRVQGPPRQPPGGARPLRFPVTGGRGGARRGRPPRTRAPAGREARPARRRRGGAGRRRRAAVRLPRRRQARQRARRDGDRRSPGAAASTSAPSTGGFTDCLLQRGAAHVVAVDVAYGELSLRLRDDARVTVLERVNARALDRRPAALRARPRGARRLVHLAGEGAAGGARLPGAALRLPRDGQAAVRGRPRARWARAAWCADPADRRATLVSVAACATAAGAALLGFASSGLPGPAGNRETFAVLAEAGRDGALDDPEAAARASSRDDHGHRLTHRQLRGRRPTASSS